MVRVLYGGGEPGILAGYNDSTNQIQELSSDGTFVEVPGQTAMGLSVYLDETGTWEPREQFPVPAGLYALRADPWLATDDSHRIVWYVILARTSDSSPCEADAIAYTASPDGGANWTPIDWFVPGVCVDKPSVAIGERTGTDVDDVTVHVAYVDEDEGEIEVITKPAGATSFDPPVAVPGEGVARNPIVRVDPVYFDQVYVTYQEIPFSGPPFGIRIAFAGSNDRAGSFDVWSFVDEGISVDEPNAANEKRLRNRTIQYFIIDPDTHHCDVAYQKGRAVMFASSLDGVNWDRRPMTDDGVMGFQPALAAGGGRVAVVWYEQEDGTSLVRVRAAVSPDHGFTWPGAGWQTLTVDGSGADVYFEPCPFDGGNGWYFGDYIGLVSLDFPEPTGRFYASWADSQDVWGTPTCDWGDINTAHQHTMGVKFE